MATPFCIVPTSHPPIITPSSNPSPTSYIYTIPVLPTRPFSHIVVFLLPGIELPPDTAAAVYIALPSAPANFKFLGGIGKGKESAIFKVGGLIGNISGSSNGGAAAGEVDMDAPDLTGSQGTAPAGEITIGISVESAASVSTQMASLGTAGTTSSATSQALVPVSKAKQQPDTLVLAQRIIKNAFNFLASFSGNVNGGVEVVPLKAFEEWWRKFEGRVRSDPGFLEKEGD